jgi:hypothetical protein
VRVEWFTVYEVVLVEHAMNALFKRAAGVEKAKIADLHVRTKQVPGGVPTDLWVDMGITHPTVGGHLNSCFTQPQGAGELKKDASLAATQKEELKAEQYAKAFPSMQEALFFGFGVDTYGAWGRRAEEFVELMADLAPVEGRGARCRMERKRRRG